jgi:hypothetical protein
MKVFATLFLVLLAATSTAAIPLKIARVSSIDCLFSPSCHLPGVTDTTADVTLSGGGTAHLQTRTFFGKPGTRAAGFYAYEYRLDLSHAIWITAIACVDSITLTFGPVVNTLNYGGDRAKDEVFVLVRTGMFGLESAEKRGDSITFTFEEPVCGSGDRSKPGRGDTSAFWGLLSRHEPQFVTARVHETHRTTWDVQARAPRL